MAVVTNATLAKIKTEIQNQNAVLRNFIGAYATNPWSGLLADVRAGYASQLYNIGDEINTTYTLDGAKYDFPWVVANIDREFEMADGSTRKGLLLQAKYACIEEIQFDAPESTDATEDTALDGWYYWGLTGTTYTKLNVATGDTLPYGDYDSIVKNDINHLDTVLYGYNNYKMSAIRQWLNSDGGKGAWWTSQHPGDQPPTQLDTRAGFLKGLDPQFASIVSPVKIQVATNTVTDGGLTDVMYDQFWLPSLEEVYGVPQAPGIEGSYFPYWKEATGLDEPSNGSSSNPNEARKIHRADLPTGSAVSVRLRSANRGSAYNVWYLYSSAYLYYYGSSHYSYRAFPACAIC